ncbi:unnamed protein product [Caenorhabditis sp. 36 PRJEB53466]|nr:unnamed protein product [Caenorhabditis sp. 36 PRJEB53466]
MDTFELDSDAFYICTEVAPRNYVVQKAIQIDKKQIERMVGKLDGKATTAETSPSETSDGTSTAHSPGTSPSTSACTFAAKPPPIPYWFNREVKSTLMMIGPQPQGSLSTPSSSGTLTNHFVPALPGAPSMTRDELKQQLKVQLEYYFSRENLMTDRYLKCQMDGEQYVPINVLAGFRKITQLTSDIDLITEALKESAIVELDPNEEKVRAITKRTTIIIREIPEEYREEVVKLLADGPPFLELTYGSNDSWYVTFENELDTQVAYVAVQHKKNEITQRPVCARIKAGGPPSVAPTEVRNGENGRLATLSNGETGTIHLKEIGRTLADYGHFEYVTPTFRFSGNNLAYQPQQPPQPTSLPLQQQQPQQYYYSSSSVSTTPRNFDEMSSASSNSTRTTTSNYNRSGSRNSGSNQYNESRNYPNSTNSNEWRGRGGSNGGERRFPNSYQNGDSNGRQSQSSRGNWRGGYRNGSNGHYQNGRENGNGGNQNNWRNEQNGYVQTWRNSGGHYNNYRNGNQMSSSSSSSASSKYFSPEANGTPTNSGPSTPPPASAQQQTYSVPTPTDLPSPPVWPAPSFDRRRKSSEASSTTITTTTAPNTVTPSTPVTPPVLRQTFVEEPMTEKKEIKEHHVHEQYKTPSTETTSNNVTEKVQSPSAVAAPPAASPLFSFEETAFPCLPKKAEPEAKPQKPTFSSVLAGRRNIKQLIPEKKTSYAEKLKQRQALLFH